MANNDKIKKLQDIGISEAMRLLFNIYKSIITYRLPKVHRKMKVYPSLAVPPYHRRVKVYDSLNVPDKHEFVELITLPDNYYPTSNTEVKHVINKERYHRISSQIANQLKRRIKRGGEYVELNNFEELFASIERSSITELYEEYFDEDDESIVLAIYDEILDASRQIVYEYRIRKAFEL